MLDVLPWSALQLKLQTLQIALSATNFVKCNHTCKHFRLAIVVFEQEIKCGTN